MNASPQRPGFLKESENKTAHTHFNCQQIISELNAAHYVIYKDLWWTELAKDLKINLLLTCFHTAWKRCTYSTGASETWDDWWVSCVTQEFYVNYRPHLCRWLWLIAQVEMSWWLNEDCPPIRLHNEQPKMNFSPCCCDMKFCPSKSQHTWNLSAK